jgi:hypothetical protein
MAGLNNDGRFAPLLGRATKRPPFNRLIRLRFNCSILWWQLGSMRLVLPEAALSFGLDCRCSRAPRGRRVRRHNRKRRPYGGNQDPNRLFRSKAQI